MNGRIRKVISDLGKTEALRGQEVAQRERKKANECARSKWFWDVARRRVRRDNVTYMRQ